MAFKISFYEKHYHQVIFGLLGLMFLLILLTVFLFHQLLNRPLPQFDALSPDGKSMFLVPYDSPNLLPDTILRWASKAATVAYTFDFVNYKNQIAAARPYFTTAGWQDYQNSVNKLIDYIVNNQLFVNGVVSGQPVISNQGNLPDKGYAWRVQIPFLVTYQSENTIARRNFYVLLSIVHVPTAVNKQGIGIDQFVMV